MPRRLDVVAIGIEHERTVVGARYCGSRPGDAVVASAGGDRFAMKSLDHREVARLEREVNQEYRSLTSNTTIT